MQKVIYQGHTYILESELEEYLKNTPDDDDEEVPLTPKEQEAEDEIARADRVKGAVDRNFNGLRSYVETLYRKYVSRYSSVNDLKRLIRGIYEIIAKRFLIAKNKGDEAVTNDWRQLILNIPGVFIEPTLVESENHPVNDIIETYYYVINTPKDAMAFIMAISYRLNELAEEFPDEGFDEIKEDADKMLASIR